MPKLSIILPVFNREKFIEKAIKSVLEQDFQDFEFIIVDDGSKDRTKKIIKKFTDKRIKYIYQDNKGEYAATNIGLKNAKGKYITWIHSDDTLLPRSLSLRVEYLDKNKDVDLVHGDIIAIDFIKHNYDVRISSDFNSKKVFQCACLSQEKRLKMDFAISHVTFMFRREVLQKTGFMDETLKFAGDLDWTLRMLPLTKIKNIHQLLYCYTRHADTVSNIATKNKLPINKIVYDIRKKYCKNV